MGWMHFNNIIWFYLFFNFIEILKLTWVGAGFNAMWASFASPDATPNKKWATA